MKNQELAMYQILREDGTLQGEIPAGLGLGGRALEGLALLLLDEVPVAHLGARGRGPGGPYTSCTCPTPRPRPRVSAYTA